MIPSNPLINDTIVDDENHTWIPRSFPDFLSELSHLTGCCSEGEHIPLFRGHSNSSWLLESTLARSCKHFILGIQPEDRIDKRIQESVDYHRVVINLLLLKYGVICRPSNENIPGKDHWFELMRELQQYPERDHHHFKGTFFIDWTTSADVALYFANLNRSTDGCLWICDVRATGKTLQTKQVGEILGIMSQRCNQQKPDAPGCPIIFHPPSQNCSDERILRQQAVYIAQMDLRFDLASFWHDQEKTSDGQIYAKLILPKGTQDECNKYLTAKGKTTTWLFPNSGR